LLAAKELFQRELQKEGLSQYRVDLTLVELGQRAFAYVPFPLIKGKREGRKSKILIYEIDPFQSYNVLSFALGDGCYVLHEARIS